MIHIWQTVSGLGEMNISRTYLWISLESNDSYLYVPCRNLEAVSGIVTSDNGF